MSCTTSLGRDSVELLSLADFVTAEREEHRNESVLGRQNQDQDPMRGLAGEKLSGRASGRQQAWHNVIPVQIDGDGLYDLSHLGIDGKCVPAMAFFDKNENGKYRYGNTSLVLQVGVESDQKLQGTVDNPLKGGVAVVNSRGGGELPRTGGAGTEAYVIAGTALVVVAGAGAAWYAIRKRKDGGDGDRDA